MSNHPPTRDYDSQLDAQFEHLAAAQQNILPHDQLANGRSIDDALWNGFERPRGVHKAALLIFSATFMMLAVALAGIAYDKHDPLGTIPTWLIALGALAIAIKIASNAFRTRKKPNL